VPKAKILSPQQAVIMQHLVDGLTIKEIAVKTQLAIVTVRRHINKSRKKFGARTQGQAIAFVVARGEVCVNLELDIEYFAITKGGK